MIEGLLRGYLRPLSRQCDAFCLLFGGVSLARLLCNSIG